MQIGNDKAAHNASNPNAQKTGDPQADVFRYAGFEQELCRFVALNEMHRPFKSPTRPANGVTAP
jgi:hypothetical protein